MKIFNFVFSGFILILAETVKELEVNSKASDIHSAPTRNLEDLQRIYTRDGSLTP